jgi:hypothetical protein
MFVIHRLSLWSHVSEHRSICHVVGRIFIAGALASVLLLLTSISALAAVAVNLRVEGSTKTLFEGSVTTEGETFETTSSKGPHPCNYAGNGNHSGETNGGNPSGTPTTALRNATLANGLAFNAEWSTELGDFFITQVGTDINQTEAPYDSWGYAVNDTTAPVGGCQIALAPGNEVLWAYNYFNLKHLLSLSGPSSAEVGVPFTVHVIDGQTGQPIAGATLGEDVNGMTTPIPASPVTDASGNATVMLTHVGTVKLKATQPESVRSNGLTVNIGSVPGSCACGAANIPPSRVEPQLTNVATIEGVANGHIYSRRSAPRLLTGKVSVPTGGTLRQVRISLERSYRGRCSDFSGLREKLVRIKCGKSAQFFSVGDTESFSYLLPARLPAGSYTYDIEAVDSSGKTTKLVNGVSHVVFRVK